MMDFNDQTLAHTVHMEKGEPLILHSYLRMIQWPARNVFVVKVSILGLIVAHLDSLFGDDNGAKTGYTRGFTN
jgi:hypothetical protein